jgi:c-di-GMP-binding flagellar brake protein YcgR
MNQQTLRILVGDKLQLQKVGSESGERYSSTVIGFVPGKSLLITTPLVNDKPILAKDGQQFAVRMLQGSYIQGFVAKVLHNALAPYPYIHLSFPEEVESKEIRNADRVETDVPILARNSKLADEQDNWKQASIKDISASGSKLESMTKVGEEGEIMVLKFKLNICAQDEEMELQTKIMHLEEPSDTGGDEWGIYTYGTRFEDYGRLERVLIQNYVLEQRMSHVI